MHCFRLFALALAMGGVVCADLPVLAQSASTNKNLPSTAAAAAPPQSTARIQFATRVHDFGTVTVGQVVKHSFAFTNTGGETLVISEVRTTCGCASIGTSSRKVNPGERGTIPFEFHTGAFNGQVAKTLTVVCNDATQPEVALEIKGTVWHPMVAVPPNAAFVGALDSLASLTKVISITNKEPEPLALFPPESTHRAVVAELKTNRIGQEYELTVKLVPPLGSGNVFADLKVKTSCPKMPLLTIPVWVVPQPAVLVLPPQVVLPLGQLTNEMSQTVVIRSNSTEPLVLSKPEVDSAAVGLEMSELQVGRHFAARLTFPAGFKIAAGQTVHLSLQSNHPKFPIIRVPIVQK